MAATVPASSDDVLVESTRDRLLKAATEVFSERGYDGAGVQEIARRAGLTTGAIYANFRNKAGLLLQTINALTTAHFDGGDRGADAAASTPDDLGDTVRSALARGNARARALLLEAFVAARRDTEVRQLLRQRLTTSTRRLTERVERAKSEGVVDPGLDTRAVVRLLQSLRFGIASLETVDTAMPTEEAWRQVSVALLRGLAPR